MGTYEDGRRCESSGRVAEGQGDFGRYVDDGDDGFGDWVDDRDGNPRQFSVSGGGNRSNLSGPCSHISGEERFRRNGRSWSRSCSWDPSCCRVGYQEPEGDEDHASHRDGDL